MKKAHKRGAVINEKFYFRKNVPPQGTRTSSLYLSLTSRFAYEPDCFSLMTDPDEETLPEKSDGTATPVNVDDEYDLFTINEIINGNVRDHFTRLFKFGFYQNS